MPIANANAVNQPLAPWGTQGNKWAPKSASGWNMRLPQFFWGR